MIISLEILRILFLLFCLCCLLLMGAYSPASFIILDWRLKLKELYLGIYTAWVQGSFAFSFVKCMLVSP